jgi:hypothetical protein
MAAAVVAAAVVVVAVAAAAAAPVAAAVTAVPVDSRSDMAATDQWPLASAAVSPLSPLHAAWQLDWLFPKQPSGETPTPP